MNEQINYFGETTFRNKKQRFGIKIDDRRRHFYTIGKSGMGKTEMITNMIIQDIQNGNGVCFLDPHGDAAERVLKFIPEHRIKDTVYFDPSDLSYPIAFNVLEFVPLELRHLVASGIMGVFKKIWIDAWSARMEYILNNCLAALLEYPDSTLLGVNKMLADKEYRKKIVDGLQDPVVKSFWMHEFAKYPDKFREEAVAPIQNKVGQFISNPLIRNIVGQTHSSINIRQIMDEKKILILNLSKGKIGEDNSKLIGGLLITKIQQAAMSRVNVPEEQRSDFYLYVDEFQNFATESFASILSEARKYHLNLILANQYVAQLTQTSEVVRDAVFGNVGTIVTFRVGAEDAEWLEKEFAPQITAQDIVNLPKYHAYMKLLIDGVTSPAFSAQTLLPFPIPNVTYEKEILEYTRMNYGTPKESVEAKIRSWSGVTSLPTSNPPLDAFSINQEKISPNALQLYTANCWVCDNQVNTSFKPDPKRPVFCPEHLEQSKQGIKLNLKFAPKEYLSKKSTQEPFEGLRPPEIKSKPKIKEINGKPLSLSEALRPRIIPPETSKKIGIMKPGDTIKL
ncbi:MAG: hypothetical protein US56_C0016G0004 [Candidatus Moranbacteria bacterium GW2011_GWF2_37_7]|nr:MAG: hypothetical protein US56_C0016G0004 [Candidatus Moranbacteria bacterium GW2011_GWF2_37_7]